MKYLVAILFIPSFLFAHPVIYKDGWVYWGEFSGNMNTQKISYTFDPKFSVESSTNWYEDIDDYRDYVFGLNYLVKRWLNTNSQGNIYLSYHAGYYKDLNSDGLTQHAMIIGDWESRSIYTAGSLMRYSYQDEELMKYSYRIGFAPFVAGMNTLQAWMILKLDYLKENNRNILITPMMRFFYRNILWEIGANTQGDYFLTLMTHY
jgi:uncharacterized protein YbgA (DUF1722 family)